MFLQIIKDGIELGSVLKNEGQNANGLTFTILIAVIALLVTAFVWIAPKVIKYMNESAIERTKQTALLEQLVKVTDKHEDKIEKLGDIVAEHSFILKGK